MPCPVRTADPTQDSSVKTHTLNPVPLLAVGPAATRLDGVRSLTEVAPRLLRILTTAST